jgi:hypothetical protein
MTRETHLRERLANGTPELIVNLRLYSTDVGGRASPIVLGFGCPCCVDRNVREAWDGYPLLDSPMMPGETRRVGFMFLSGRRAVEALSSSGCFFLWEAKLIGEAQIVR